jgi:hypothetical protein
LVTPALPPFPAYENATRGGGGKEGGELQKLSKK